MLAAIDKSRLAYTANKTAIAGHKRRVIFGDSGHRGSSRRVSFNEAHVPAIARAVRDFRKGRDISGPFILGGRTTVLWVSRSRASGGKRP